MHGRHDELPTLPDLTRWSDFAIGAASIRPATRRVSGPGGEVIVEPRVMHVLLALVDAGGAVVSREALFKRCWGSVHVGEDSLNRAIAEVRRLARETAAGSFTIETIPRTGYRLVVAEAVVGSSTTEAIAPAAEPPPPLPSRRLVMAGGVIAALGGLAYWSFPTDPTTAQVEALIEQSEQSARRGLPDSDAQGAGFLEEATRLQPGNAEAWGKLALARTHVAEYAPPERMAAAVAGVQDAARRALALDRRQADAHGALAILPPHYGDWGAAELRMRAVLRDHPEHLPTGDALAFMLVGVGRGREGSRQRLALAAREPLHATHQFKLIYSHWFLGDVGAADRAAERALQLWPRHPGVWLARLNVLAYTGRPERALAHLEDVPARPDMPPFMFETMRASMVALISGRPADRAIAIERALADVALGPSLSVNGMMILTGLGELDRAFDLADAYLLEQGPLMAGVRWRKGQVSINDQRRRKTHMLFVPSASALRADSRFLTLVERMGLADYWRRSGVTPDFLTSGEAVAGSGAPETIGASTAASFAVT